MALNVVNFYNLKPKLPFKFKTQWFTGLLGQADEILSYSVTSITLPKYDGDNNSGLSHFGDKIISMPVFTPGTRKLEITFEETDTMLISRFIEKLLYKGYSKKPWYITIVITEYDFTMHKEFPKGYICHLLSYDEPAFKRDGQAQSITMNLTFLVDCVINKWEGQVFYGEQNEKSNDDFNATIKELNVKEENEAFRFGNLEVEFNPGVSTSTQDFDVTEAETNAALRKIHQTNPVADVTYDELRRVQEENARRMATAKSSFEQKLKEHGINISVNDYNGTNHEAGLGTKSGSHLLGQKIDLNFTDNNNNKITADTLTKEQLNAIKQAAEESGLVINWESKNGKGSFWGDFALKNAMSIDSRGNVIENQKMSTWTGEDKFKNLSIKDKESSYQKLKNS